MKKFTNPLNKIKIASPCPANWNEMYGDERKRHCAECKLNVYNLSDMTRQEAENFLINSEGRVCVKFYRRSDGTVLTQDCPVGWAKMKRNISRAATSVFSICVGIFSGIFTYTQFHSDITKLKDAVVVESDNSAEKNPAVKFTGSFESGKGKMNKGKGKRKHKKVEAVLGRVENIRELKDEPVVAWIQ